MAYNYFVCRKHPIAVKFAVQQTPGIPGAYASPMCPTCGKTMEKYSEGVAAQDPFPVPPPLPAAVAAVAMPNVDQAVYSGNGPNGNHPHVTWAITRNLAKRELRININLGQQMGGAWQRQLTFRADVDTLAMAQGPNIANWWLTSPMPNNADHDRWHRFDLRALVGPGNLGGAPAIIDIGVKLGNSVFGLIHLLAEHADSLRNLGDFTVDTSPHQITNSYGTIVAIQSGLQRFDTARIQQVNYDAIQNKLQIRGSDGGFLVIRRSPGDPRYAITTIYNMNRPAIGQQIYP